MSALFLAFLYDIASRIAAVSPPSLSVVEARSLSLSKGRVPVRWVRPAHPPSTTLFGRIPSVFIEKNLSVWTVSIFQEQTGVIS
jgi:hypothetical protein